MTNEAVCKLFKEILEQLCRRVLIRHEFWLGMQTRTVVRNT